MGSQFFWIFCPDLREFVCLDTSGLRVSFLVPCLNYLKFGKRISRRVENFGWEILRYSINPILYACILYFHDLYNGHGWHMYHIWIATLLVASNIRWQACGEGVADSQLYLQGFSHIEDHVEERRRCMDLDGLKSHEKLSFYFLFFISFLEGPKNL